MPQSRFASPATPVPDATPSALSLDDLRLFCRVARLGTLSAVARERNAPVSQVSRALQRIEAAYGVRLVHRSTHGLSLTPEGELFQASCERVGAELDELGAELMGKTQAVAGLVRVSMSSVLAEHLLVPSLPALAARHPRLKLDFCVDDRIVDMAREGIDIAIRTGAPTSDMLVMRPLGQLARRLYASPAYAQAHGLPDSPEALERHHLIANTSLPGLNRWQLRSADGGTRVVLADGHFRSDHTATLAAMTLAGLGIGRLVSVVGEPLVAQGRLLPVLPGLSAEPPVPVSAVMLAERHRLPKVRACVEHWADWLARLTPLEPSAPRPPSPPAGASPAPLPAPGSAALARTGAAPA